MNAVHPTFAPLLRNPFIPAPINPDALQALRAQAWAEVAAIEAADGRYHRALQQQQQAMHASGELREYQE